MDGILGAGRAQEQSADEIARAGWEIRAIFHDITSANHERGYRALGMFLLPAVWRFVSVDVSAIEIQPNDEVISHRYHAGLVANQSMLFLIAHRWHMMWGKPTASTTEAEWRDWANVATLGPVANHPVMGWKQRLEEQSKEEMQTDSKPTIRPRGHCGQVVKIGLPAVPVGAYGIPGGSRK